MDKKINNDMQKVSSIRGSVQHLLQENSQGTYSLYEV